MGIVDTDIQSQLQKLSTQLDNLRLTHRDSSLKSKREQQILKRVVGSLGSACHGSDEKLSTHINDLQLDLEQQCDISELIPRLAVLERMLRQQSKKQNVQSVYLEEQVKHSGEVLQRITGLPAQLKRELRNFITFSENNSDKRVDQAVKLLSLYERALKIISSNSKVTFQNHDHAPDSTELQMLSLELQRMIGELDFGGDCGDQLLDIRSKLLLGTSAETLVELTLTSLKVVVKATTMERQAAQKYVQGLNSSLTSVLKSSTNNLDQFKTNAEHRRELNAELDTLVTQGQHRLNEAQDFEQLKAEMNPLFNQITMLTERLKMAEEREKTLQDRLSFNNKQLETLHGSSNQECQRMEENSERLLQDPLTKLLNRSAFMVRLETEYRRWVRSQTNMRLVMLDIDNFKMINDSYGYTAGDKALKIISRTIHDALEQDDILCRFGGEEFMLIAPEKNDEYTLELIKKIQHDVSKLPFKFREQDISITMTASSTAFNDSDTPEVVVDRLYAMLQKAKVRGKNQLDWV